MALTRKMQAFSALRAEAFAVCILPPFTNVWKENESPRRFFKASLNQLLSYIDLGIAFGRCFFKSFLLVLKNFEGFAVKYLILFNPTEVCHMFIPNIF